MLRPPRRLARPQQIRNISQHMNTIEQNVNLLHKYGAASSGTFERAYTAVYRISLMHEPGTGRRVAILMFKKLIAIIITHCESLVKGAPVSDEAKFLTYIDRKAHQFKLAADKVSAMFGYTDRVPGIQEDLDAVTTHYGIGLEGSNSKIFEIHEKTLDLVFFPKVEKKCRRSALRLILNPGPHDVLHIPLIRDLVISRTLQSSTLLEVTQRRPIYLVPRSLDQVALVKGSTAASLAYVQSFLGSLPWNLFATYKQAPQWVMISHWALIIDSPICADGQTKSRQSLGCDLRVAAAPTAGSSRYLLELKVVPRRGHKSISLSTVNIEGNTFENSSTESRQKWEPLQAAVLLGYTSYFNEEIHRKAERVIDSMASDYNAVSNNCQTFCTRLFTCIGIPNTEDEILSEIWTVPTSLQAEVELRRCIDYLVTRLLDLYANHARMAPSTIPMAINSLIKTALIIMTILALFLSFLLDTRLYYFLSLLSLAWGFYGRFNTMLIGSQHIPRPAWTDELLETTASMLFPSEIETDAQLHGIGTRDVW